MKKYLISGFNTVQEVKLEAGTYTLVAYAKSMHSNVYTFALGDGENWTEYDIDVVQGQLCKVWLTFTIDKKATKFKPIANNFTEELPVYVTDLQLTKGNIPVEAGASPFDIDKILNDLHDGIDAIEDFAEGAFLDGLLSREEKTQLRASLDSIGAIVESVKGSYNKLLDNPFIHENTMDNITARYYAFIASWISDGDPRGLKPVILWIVNGDNIVSQNEREEKDRALNAFNDALYAYNQAEKEVYSDMGDDYTGKIDDAIIKATYWVIDSSSPIIYKDASAYNISGYHKPVTVRGELRRGEGVTIGGFITVTPNGLAEGSPKASPVEIAPLNNAGREMYTIKLYNDLNKTKLLDEMTIPVALSGSRGVDAINVTMSNESDTVPADADGLVRDYTGTGTNIRVFEGTTELEYGASTNGRYTVIGSSDTVTIGSIIKSGIHCKVNDATFIDNDKASILFTVSGKTINGDSFSIEKKQSITRVRTGEDAPLLYLSPSSQVMVCDSDNNSKPNQNIEVKAKLQNVTGTATFTASPYNDNGIALANITLGGSGNLRTLKSNQWLSTFNKVEVTATLGDLSDTVTIHRLADAENSITGYLTNENITLQASSTGVVSSFDNAIGVFKVHDGELVVSSGVAYSSVSQSGCTVSIDALGAYKVLTMPADDAIAKFKAVYKNVEIIRELKLSKSKQGNEGDDGKDGYSVSLSKETHTYTYDKDGNLKGLLSNGATTISVQRGDIFFKCDTTDIGYLPDTNNTYRVVAIEMDGVSHNGATRTLVNDEFKIWPSAFTGETGSMTFTIRAMSDGVVSKDFKKTISFSKNRDGADGTNGLPPEVENTIMQYALGSSKTEPPTLGWVDNRAMLVPSTSTPYEWSRQKITYKNSTQVIYVGYVLITNISPMTYFFGEWDCRVKYTRSEKSYPIVTYLKGTGNKPLHYYPKNEGVIEYIWFIKPNVDDPSTWYKKNDLVLYENDGSNGDPVCPLGIFKSKYDNKKYLPSVSSWWENVTAKYAPNGIEGQKLWEFADGVELIITEALMANFAKLDSFVFNKGKMFSQQGNMGDYTDEGFIPNFEIDGVTGKMKALDAEISGEITATSGNLDSVTVTNADIKNATIDGLLKVSSGYEGKIGDYNLFWLAPMSAKILTVPTTYDSKGKSIKFYNASSTVSHTLNLLVIGYKLNSEGEIVLTNYTISDEAKGARKDSVFIPPRGSVEVSCFEIPPGNYKSTGGDSMVYDRVLSWEMTNREIYVAPQ